ncbi:ROK family protein [Rhodoferax sp.]|uniref:ROK family transcriptional regulator n=1 Tax=Rhodoferax sp. TaxID=50421 RepID=UPI00374D4ACA
MNLSGTNLENAGAHNRRVVMEAIRIHKRLSRADITRLTGLTPQTISNITRELVEMGFLIALPPERVGRGQPAVPFTINPDGAYSIGIQLNHHELNAVAADLSGAIVARGSLAVDRLSPTEAVEPIRAMVQQLQRTAQFDWQRLVGVGVAIPGPFGVDGMSAVGPTTLPGWLDLSAGKQLSTALNLPVTVANDASAAAIGERLYGAGQTLQNFVYLYIGEGLGAGLFLNGQMFEGSANNAGELGHVVVVRDGRACYCGNHGCLERYVSLLAAYEVLGFTQPAQATPADLLSLSAKDTKKLDIWLDEAAPYLRQAVNMLECMLDVETIILGGLLPRPVLERLMQRLDPLYISVGTRPDREIPRLQLGMLGEDTAALGAAALPIFNKLNPSLELLRKSR